MSMDAQTQATDGAVGLQGRGGGKSYFPDPMTPSAAAALPPDSPEAQVRRAAWMRNAWTIAQSAAPAEALGTVVTMEPPH